jgi:hypothetical protein
VRSGARRATTASNLTVARQRNEEKVRRLNQGDIKVLGAGPVVVGQDMRRGWSVKPSLASRKVEGLGSIAKAWDWEGNGFRGREPRNSMEHL